MMTVVLESALRTLLMTATAWVALRLFGVRHVVAQKITWSLVLLAAVAMPLLTGWQSLKIHPAVALPDYRSASKTVSTIVPSTSFPVRTSVESAPVVAKNGMPAITHGRYALFHVTEKATPPVTFWNFAQFRSLIAGAYITVCSILLLRLFFGFALALRVWFRARRVYAPAGARANVRISSEIFAPATIGFGVVLPTSFPSWDGLKQRVVLAHESSHVRQADFYLQFLARLHTAIFWFNPAAWWLQRELSDLGEAISDHAGIREAADRSSYAEVLLEFAAISRRPLVGVPMARSSNIQRRIDRLLTDSLFVRAFSQRRTHAVIAALIVPVALMTSTALITVRAAVEPSRGQAANPPVALRALRASPALQALPVLQALQVPVVAPRAVTLAIAPVPAQEAASAKPPAPPALAVNARRDNDSEQDAYSFMVVSGDSSNVVNFNGDSRRLERFRKQLHGNYILFERDGKYSVIDDPALVNQAEQMMKPIEELGRQQEALGSQQEALGEEQERLGKLQEEASVPTPDMSKELAGLKAALDRLENLQKSQTLKQEDLAEIQGKIGDIEGRLGEIQGRIGEKQGTLGEQQGRLGEKQGKLGEEQGKLGEQQGKLSEEFSAKMKVMIDKAVREGKAKPVE